MSLQMVIFTRTLRRPVCSLMEMQKRIFSWGITGWPKWGHWFLQESDKLVLSVGCRLGSLFQKNISQEWRYLSGFRISQYIFISRWGTFFFFPFLFLSLKSTHDLKANQTHPQIPALPGRDSSLFKLAPFRHLHKSIDLSLIHIWRCRRSTLCRSRWSPYH